MLKKQEVERLRILKTYWNKEAWKSLGFLSYLKTCTQCHRNLANTCFAHLNQSKFRHIIRVLKPKLRCLFSTFYDYVMKLGKSHKMHKINCSHNAKCWPPNNKMLIRRTKKTEQHKQSLIRKEHGL